MEFSLIFVFILNLTLVYSDVKTEIESQTTNVEPPPDIISVSSFIEEFHRKLEKEDYPIIETNALLDEILPPFESLQKSRNATEKNVTTLVNCNKTNKNIYVEIVNASRLATILTPDANVTTRLAESQCVILLFYKRSCPFSCLAAPHFNALPRAFPMIRMVAVNAQQYQSFNTQYGIAGVPTLMLFHNGRAVAKFNDSEYTLKMFTKFIMRFTGLKPTKNMYVASSDFGGPVPSKLQKDTDYFLGLAWAVILLAISVAVSKSRRWKTLVEVVQNTWREAQAHHDHTD